LALNNMSWLDSTTPHACLRVLLLRREKACNFCDLSRETDIRSFVVAPLNEITGRREPVTVLKPDAWSNYGVVVVRTSHRPLNGHHTSVRRSISADFQSGKIISVINFVVVVVIWNCSEILLGFCRLLLFQISSVSRSW
jgi:hypothetical protein